MEEEKELLPPWKKYPELNRFSIAWRMGYGESYLMEWSEWYFQLSPEQKSVYIKKYPEPLLWKAFYE